MLNQLITISEQNWDKWRELYDQLSFHEHQLFYNILESLYPEQKHFDLEFAKRVFEEVKPKHVTEAGGWKGELANELFNSSGVWTWFIYELCDAAKAKCITNEICYMDVFCFDWWNYEIIPGDLFLATHFIEHLSDVHFESLASNLEFPYVYFESPLSWEGQDWKGYNGTHKLTYGWKKVIEVMSSNGFEVKMTNGTCYLFKKKW